MHKVETKSKKEANQIVGGYKGPVFTDRVGRKEVEAARLKYEEGSKPAQPARYGAGLGETVQGVALGQSAMVQDKEAGPCGMMQNEGTGLDVKVEDEGEGLDNRVEVVGAGPGDNRAETNSGDSHHGKTDIGDSEAVTNLGYSHQDGHKAGNMAETSIRSEEHRLNSSH